MEKGLSFAQWRKEHRVLFALCTVLIAVILLSLLFALCAPLRMGTVQFIEQSVLHRPLRQAEKWDRFIRATCVMTVLFIVFVSVNIAAIFLFAAHKNPIPLSDKDEKVFRLALPVALVCSFALFAVLLLADPHGVQEGVFFLHLQDLFADFWNPLRWIAERDPYHNEDCGLLTKCYLPLAYIMLYPFTAFADFAHLEWNKCYYSINATMTCVVFLIICTALMICSLQCFATRLRRTALGGRKSGEVFARFAPFILFFTGVFWFSIERGNIIMVSVASIYFFLAFHDSENKRLRIFAALCLAVSAVLKIYPVVFGFLYLKKRQWKDIAVAASIALVLTFVPFLFFKGGLGNVPLLIHIMGLFNHAYGHHLHFVYGFGSLVEWVLTSIGYWKVEARVVYGFVRLIELCLSIAALFMCLAADSEFWSVTLLTMALLFLPATGGEYAALYAMPLVLYHLVSLRERSIVQNAVLSIALFLMFTPLQWGFGAWGQFVSLNRICANVAAFTMLLMGVVVAARGALERHKAGELSI